MGDKGQEKWISGNEQAEVEGHRFTAGSHEAAPAGDADAEAETPEVEGRLFRVGGEAADAEALLMARDKER